MDSKCVNKGSEIEWCKYIAHCIKEGLGDFEAKVLSRLSDMESRHVLVAGSFKKNKVKLAYCPACGADIQTNYKEVSA